MKENIKQEKSVVVRMSFIIADNRYKVETEFKGPLLEQLGAINFLSEKLNRRKKSILTEMYMAEKENEIKIDKKDKK